MVLAFCRMTRSKRTRWVAKKLSVPWRTHPDSREKGEGPRVCVAAAWDFALVALLDSDCCIAASNTTIDLQVFLCQYQSWRAAVQQAKPIVIRKYPNRRLYDTSSRRYVNLDDVAALVRQGAELPGGRRQNRRRPDAHRAYADHRGGRQRPAEPGCPWSCCGN